MVALFLYSQWGGPIEFVLPAGFHGPIWVVEDPNVDTTLDSTYSTLEGYSIRVPENGVLRFSSVRPFKKWHSITARFEDGTDLYDGDAGYYLRDGTTAFRRGGSAVTKDGLFTVYYHVGPRGEAAKFFSEKPLPNK